MLAVSCERAGEGACVEWRYERQRGGEDASAAPPAEAGLDSAGVADLCARFGARFTSTAAGVTLILAGAGA